MLRRPCRLLERELYQEGRVHQLFWSKRECHRRCQVVLFEVIRTRLPRNQKQYKCLQDTRFRSMYRCTCRSYPPLVCPWYVTLLTRNPCNHIVRWCMLIYTKCSLWNLYLYHYLIFTFLPFSIWHVRS